MKWEKLGQTFVFDESPFAKHYVSHAQSPQALVMGDRVRVYFSTRKEDTPGLFTSYVQYVDFGPDLKTIIGYSDHEVIALGELGCFDEHGIFPLSPTVVDDNKIYAYTNGISRRVSVPVETGIGFAISTDGGVTYTKPGNGPIMSSSLNEPFLVGDAFVRMFDGKFHMFYLFGKKWSEATGGNRSERVYKIGHAISDNGVDWQRTGGTIIDDVLNGDECQALPTVIQIGSRYHMYFCYRQMEGFRTDKNKGYRLGYAYSDDLKEWTRDDSGAGIELSSDGWDSDMMCYPNIFQYNDDIFLLYNGNDFGRKGFGVAKLNR